MGRRGYPDRADRENARPQRGLVVRDETLGGREITCVRGMPVTTVSRTAFDWAATFPATKAVARLDALMRATPFSNDEVNVLAAQHKGVRGIRRLSAALALVDGGAMSPRKPGYGCCCSTPAYQNPQHSTVASRPAFGRRVRPGLGGIQGRRGIRR